MSTKTVSIIVSPQDEVHLAAVAERFPLVTRHKLAQAAYRYGLRACVRCPDLIVEEARLAEGATEPSTES